MKALKTGKLKSDFLERLLGKIEIDDKRVIVGPGIGEDAAVIDIGERYLIVKSDPITFASERIGWYVVNINANDIAAMGGDPRWFLVTMLLPERKTTVSLIDSIMRDLKKSCAEIGISLIGGHTEVTHGLEYPILSGTMLGEAKKDELINNGCIQEGDLLFLTKGVAIEATSILAREKSDEIIKAFGKEFHKRCASFLEIPGISVIQDSKKARMKAKVTGMHDPTEGGVLTGAYEMARGAGVGLNIYLEKIPVFEETWKLCRYFKISPFNSIASGSLLISVSKGESRKLENAFKGEINGVSHLSLIGEFTKKGEPVYVIVRGKKRVIHPTGRDDIARII